MGRKRKGVKEIGKEKEIERKEKENKYK